MKLLRLLEKKWFYHVNGTNKKLADIKIIASSPLPLKHYVKTNQFNPELYYALDITHLNIPALRQRKEDIEILANQFLTQISLNDKHKCKILSSEALEKITSYNWPHNLNQLKNQLYKASKSSQDNIIESNDIIIDDYIPLERSIAKASLPDAVADFEKQFLKQWYKKHTSTRKLASVLGVSHTTIAQKLNKYGIN
jgi:transcriptional regulator of aroF, aroG, tyrA and aromatic amino acid transport